MSEPIKLSSEQKDILLVLAYLFIRMGQYDKAERLFLALDSLNAENTEDRWVARNLAIIALNKGELTKALEYLRNALTSGTLPTKDAVLYLLKAEILWKLGRADEANNALSTYNNMLGLHNTPKVNQ